MAQKTRVKIAAKPGAAQRAARAAAVPATTLRRTVAPASALTLVLTLALATAGPALALSKAKERLAADLELLTAGSLENSPIVPKNDRKRTAKCLAQALVNDIPDEDAARLSDIFEGRVSKSDPVLQKKWLTINAKDAPARNAQVLQAVDKLCPDLGPYVKQMM